MDIKHRWSQQKQNKKQQNSVLLVEQQSIQYDSSKPAIFWGIIPPIEIANSRMVYSLGVSYSPFLVVEATCWTPMTRREKRGDLLGAFEGYPMHQLTQLISFFLRWNRVEQYVWYVM